jgi:hypothetical protein
MIHLSESLSLPNDAVTQPFAFLARRGAGKSYGAMKLAEGMLDIGAQVLAIDPVGIWYSLRIAADGKGKGYDLPIFGGLHADLQRKLAAAPVQKEIERVEVPVLPDSVTQELRQVCGDVAHALDRFVSLTDQIQGALARVQRPTSVVTPRPEPRQIIPKTPTAEKVEQNAPAQFRAGAIRMLEACAQFEARGLTRAQIGALSGIRQGPTFSTYFAELRRAGYLIEQSGRVFATPEGIAFLPSVPAKPRNGEEILARWRGEFRAGAVRMLDSIVEAYPQPLSRDALEQSAGILKGPTFSTYLGELKRAELIDERDGGLYAAVLDLVTL